MLRRSAVSAALLALMWLPAEASERLVLADSCSPVAVSIADAADGTMRLEGRFTAAVSSAVAWTVLTDYDHIQAFVTSMRSSHVKSRANGIVLVEQESVGRALFFRQTFHLLLKVREEPCQSITFEDVSRASFASYEGSWKLRETASGIEVTYRLAAKGGFMAPGFVVRGASTKIVRDLLDQVWDEMRRRSEVTDAQGPAKSGPAHLCPGLRAAAFHRGAPPTLRRQGDYPRVAAGASRRGYREP